MAREITERDDLEAAISMLPFGLREITKLDLEVGAGSYMVVLPDSSVVRIIESTYPQSQGEQERAAREWLGRRDTVASLARVT